MKSSTLLAILVLQALLVSAAVAKGQGMYLLAARLLTLEISSSYSTLLVYIVQSSRMYVRV